jgi:predicted outer membrane repeat protein
MQPVINKSMTIDGQGHTIDGNYVTRIFFVMENNSVTLKNINFVNAKTRGSGGAIYFSYNSTAEIINCNFTNCSAKNGGGVYFSEDSNSFITDSNFNNCSSQFGGAIYLSEGGNFHIEDSNFKDNAADVLGGCIVGDDVLISIKRSSFEKSSASYESGGAINLALSEFYAEEIEVIECSSVFGGAITLLDTYCEIRRSAFRGNSALYDGGAIFAMHQYVTLDDNSFSDNSANRGGGFYSSVTSNTIINNEFTNNSARDGGAIFEMASEEERMDGNIFQDNTGIHQDISRAVNDNLTIYSNDYYRFNYKEVNITEIPSYYNMSDYNLLTPVKDQGIDGNCWAFSAIAALESCILKAATYTLDLSEANLKNIMARYSDYGSSLLVNQGGRNDMVYGYFASWLGPILEVDNAYYTNDYMSPLLKSILHIQNILFLKRDDFTDNDDIKSAILRYGAVSTGMFYDDYYLKNNVSYYFNGKLYYNDSLTTNHAVCIVGWNDTYSKYNFNDTPSGDGAWIVRNSWGPDWGNEGYFYVSYYDALFAEVNETSSYTFILNDTVKLNRVYQLEVDPTIVRSIENDFVAYRNFFTVEGDEYLAAVSTYFYDECNYNIKIYVNDELRAIKNGKTIAGYYTINLDDYIYLNEGDIVIVEFNCTNEVGRGFFPLSTGDYNANLFLKGGVSYYWQDDHWSDLYLENKVACIKIFTTFLDDGKSEPYFEVLSREDIENNSFVISIILPNDATGTVLISNADGQYSINLSESRSIRLYGLNSSNNLLFVKYSGDEQYHGTSLYHTVDVKAENASCEELLNKIESLGDGGVLNLTNDYYFDSQYAIEICNSITIDGQGHTIDGCYLSGIFNIYGENVVLKNIRFINSFSQYGAIAIIASNCTIINCTFISNQNENGRGGAISCAGDNCSLENCSFINNYAKNAGAIFWYGISGKVNNCTFINNFANDYGGAICWVENDGLISNCKFINNSVLSDSDEAGGAIFLYANRTMILNCQFAGNNASIGGAIYSGGCGGIMANSFFIENSASFGGAIIIVGDEFTIQNCNFTDNTADNGGAIYCQGDDADLINSTFVNTLEINQIYWYSETGNIEGCRFLNTTHGNVVFYGENFIKRDVDLNYTNDSFEHNNPVAVLLYSDILKDIPILDPLSVKLSKDGIIKTFNVTFKDGVVSIYDELFDLDIGIWNVEATFDGDDNYNPVNTEFTVTVTKIASYLTLIVANATIDHEIELTALVTDSNMHLIDEGRVALFDGNIKIGEENVVGGQAIFNYKPTTSGEHTITANYSADNYLGSNGTGKVWVDSASIEMAAGNGIVGYETTLTANVNALYSTVNDGIVSFYISDKYVGNMSVVNGLASLTYAPLSAGTFTVKAVYSGSAKFSDMEDTAGFAVDKADSKLTIDDLNATVGKEVVLLANVGSSNNLTINEGKVTFFDGKSPIGEVDVLNGIARLAFMPTTGGEHVITAIYSSDNYLNSNDTARIAADSAIVEIIVEKATVGYNTTLRANVKAIYSNVTDGFVSFYFGDKLAGKVPVSSGAATFTYLPLNAANTTLKAVYTGSERFSDTENTTDYAINPADSQVTVLNLSGTVGSSLILVANVTSQNGLTVNEGTVTFEDDGIFVGTADVFNGVARLSHVPAYVGTHRISATFNSDNYLESSNSAEMSIDPAATEITIRDITAYYNAPVTIGATISSGDGAVSEGKVKFYINGIEIRSLNVVNGYVGFEHTFTDIGPFNVSAIYSGSGNYNSSKDSKIFTVGKLPTNIVSGNVNVIYNNGGTLVASLKDINGNPLSGMTVLVNLNGVKTLNSDANGQVKLSVNGLVPKTYNVAITFDGNDYYVESSSFAKVVVLKATPKLAASKKTFKAKVKTKKYAVTLKDNKGRAINKARLTLKVKGKTFKATTNTKGKATFKIKKLNKKGKYSATVNFAGNSCFNGISKKVKITVKK